MVSKFCQSGDICSPVRKSFLVTVGGTLRLCTPGEESIPEGVSHSPGKGSRPDLRRHGACEHEAPTPQTEKSTEWSVNAASGNPGLGCLAAANPRLPSGWCRGVAGAMSVGWRQML